MKNELGNTGSIARPGDSRNSPALSPLKLGVHFASLGCAGSLLALTNPWRPHGLLVSFGLYGALHSTALVVCLRASTSGVRRAAFVALAASLATLSVLLGIGIQRATTALHGVATAREVATFCSGMGAITYALLVRWFWIDDLRLFSMVLIAAGCVATTYAVLRLLEAPQALGGLWLAVAWWLAFSTSLYFSTTMTYADADVQRGE